jgi:hypothetical protein
VVDRVQSFQPVCGDTKGSLFGGATFIGSGLVGDGYFMTAGHFHIKMRALAKALVAKTGLPIKRNSNV